MESNIYQPFKQRNHIHPYLSNGDIRIDTWNTAYYDKINSGTFGTGDGIITLTQQDAGTVNIDIDGRYYTHAESDGKYLLNTTDTLTGDLDVTGTLVAAVKSFRIPHPTKEGMKLQYGVLEGPEHSVYIRGKLDGTNVIELPEYWSELVDEDTITVNLTAFGKSQNLRVKDVNSKYITVSAGLFRKVKCFYSVFAERKDVAKLITEF